jgi:lambda repressor-like predicted transcriptional regulator
MIVTSMADSSEMQQLSDEIASVLIARLMREVQHFVANSLIQDGASADEIWSRFLEHLKGKTSSPKGR